MSADVVGTLLIVVPLIIAAAVMGLTAGWDVLAIVLAALLAAGAVSGVITFGAFLIAEGWPT